MTPETATCFCVNVKSGTYKNQVVLAVPEVVTIRANNPERKVRTVLCVDTCIAREVQQLWYLGIATTGCCCGHNYLPPYIGVENKYIPKMKELGYQMQPNNTDPKRQDSFVPKSLAAVQAHNARIRDTSNLHFVFEPSDARSVVLQAKEDLYFKSNNVEERPDVLFMKKGELRVMIGSRVGHLGYQYIEYDQHRFRFFLAADGLKQLSPIQPKKDGS